MVMLLSSLLLLFSLLLLLLSLFHFFLFVSILSLNIIIHIHSLYLSIYLSINLSIYLSIYLSISSLHKISKTLMCSLLSLTSEGLEDARRCCCSLPSLLCLPPFMPRDREGGKVVRERTLVRVEGGGGEGKQGEGGGERVQDRVGNKVE